MTLSCSVGADRVDRRRAVHPEPGEPQAAHQAVVQAAPDGAATRASCQDEQDLRHQRLPAGVDL